MYIVGVKDIALPGLAPIDPRGALIKYILRNARVCAPPISMPIFRAVIDYVTLQCECGTTVLEWNDRMVPSVNTV